MFHVRRLAAASLLCLAAAACSPPAPKPTPPVKPANPAAARAASPVAVAPDAPTGALLPLGSFTYANYGTRDLRGKAAQPVDAGNFYFKGTFLRGSPGQRLKLQVRNVDQQPHNLSLPSQGVDLDLPPGGQRFEANVTVPESGAIRFFCKLHAERGMNGQLLAEDADPQPVAGRTIDRPEL